MFIPKAAPAPAPAQSPVGQPGNMPDPATLANGTTAPTTAPAPGSAEPNTPADPLAPFADMWKSEPAAPGEQPTGLGLTQEAVQGIVSKTDFSKVISPEALVNIAQGGEAAQAAFAQAMNQVAQHVMVQSTMVNNKLSEQQIERAIQAQLSKLPQTLRQQSSSDHLKSTNPLFSNPAIKPVVEATHAQILQKFPNATHAEVTKMTQDYILAMGAAFAPPQVVNDNSGEGNTDWSKFLEQP